MWDTIRDDVQVHTILKAVYTCSLHQRPPGDTQTLISCSVLIASRSRVAHYAAHHYQLHLIPPARLNLRLLDLTRLLTLSIRRRIRHLHVRLLALSGLLGVFLCFPLLLLCLLLSIFLRLLLRSRFFGDLSPGILFLLPLVVEALDDWPG